MTVKVMANNGVATGVVADVPRYAAKEVADECVAKDSRIAYVLVLKEPVRGVVGITQEALAKGEKPDYTKLPGFILLLPYDGDVA